MTSVESASHYLKPDIAEDHEKISPTAKLVAYFRTYSDIPYAREIAAASGANSSFREIGGNLEVAKRFAPLFESRYKAINKALRESGVHQVLEIGSGLSSRGLEFTDNPEVEYVETDLPGILAEKEKVIKNILSQAKSEGRDNLHFEQANIINEQSLSQATKHFNADPVGIVSEGVMLYLTREEAEQAAENIKQLLKLHGGVWITDIVTRKSMEKLMQSSEEVKRLVERVSGATERTLQATPFSDEIDAEEFFTRHGFRIKKFSQGEEVNNLSSVDSLKLDVNKTRELLKSRGIWALELV